LELKLLQQLQPPRLRQQPVLRAVEIPAKFLELLHNQLQLLVVKAEIQIKTLVSRKLPEMLS
jgi:hypothetical protein